MDKTEAARYIASLRQTKERTCPVCGTRFSTIATGRYCSDKCRWTANNHKRAERATWRKE